MIRVSIYEDNTQLRGLLGLLIAGTAALDMVGCYADCRAVAQQVEADRPDVIVMDIEMPADGFEAAGSSQAGIRAISRVKAVAPDVRVLMHTVFDDDEHLFACLQAGADGYILKKDTSVSLIPAISDVSAGGAPMSPEIARRVLQAFRPPLRTTESMYCITPREREILELLTQGMTYRQIALQSTISTETVRRHLKNIYQKLHVQSGTEAVAKAIRERLLRP
ncbi:MAG: response regulator transcription factor [Bacteroidetes bacterium]|nr:response regulator transcription factor [Fibrella sp.]